VNFLLEILFLHGSTSRLECLTDWDDKTLIRNNKYMSQSDLYQFGKMLNKLDMVDSEVGK